MSSTQSLAPHAASPSTVRWGGVFAGVAVALGLMATLFALGLGTGFSSLAPDAEGRIKAVGIFAGTWGALVPLLSLFAGGFVAARSGGSRTASGGLLHGLTMWGVVAAAFMWLTFSAIGGVVSGVGEVVGGIGKTVASAAGSAGDALGKLGGVGELPEELSQHFHLDADDALKPVNLKLQQAGKKPLTGEQLEKATEQALKSALLKGEVDRKILIDAISSKTSIDRADAESVASSIETQVQKAKTELKEKAEEAKSRLSALQDRAKEKVGQVANDSADVIAKIFWSLFAALGLGLLSASGGGFVAGMTER